MSLKKILLVPCRSKRRYGCSSTRPRRRSFYCRRMEKQPAHRPRNKWKAGILTGTSPYQFNSVNLAASRLAENIHSGHRQAGTQNNQPTSTGC